MHIHTHSKSSKIEELMALKNVSFLCSVVDHQPVQSCHHRKNNALSTVFILCSKPQSHPQVLSHFGGDDRNVDSCF
jgi:hypothetical protein